jgi:hypothetical protein
MFNAKSIFISGGTAAFERHGARRVRDTLAHAWMPA